MPFDDMFDPIETIHNLQCEIAELKEEKEHLEFTYMYLQNERIKMIYAYREAKILQDEYRATLKKEDWELIEKEADKKFAKWIKNHHNIEQVKVEATLQP